MDLLKSVSVGMRVYGNLYLQYNEGRIIYANGDSAESLRSFEAPSLPNSWSKPIKSPIIFITPEVEAFAKEQGVVFSHQITGDISDLKKGRISFRQQSPLGKGRDYAYVAENLISKGLIKNQTPEHFLSVCYIASWLIERGVSCTVGHYEGCDIIAHFPDGILAIEWQTVGNNERTLLISKQKRGLQQYGRIIFTGSLKSCEEMMTRMPEGVGIFVRGVQLNKLLTGLCDKNKNNILTPILRFERKETKYAQYIKSDLWQARSLEYRQERGGICEDCHNNVGVKMLETHHIAYKVNLIRDDNKKYWLAVCRDCHEKIHGIRRAVINNATSTV